MPLRLKLRMDELGWSDGEVSRRTGVTRSVVTRIRNGGQLDGLTCTTAIALASGLEVSLDWLLMGSGSASAAPATAGRRPRPPVVAACDRLIVEPSSEVRIIQALQRALDGALAEARQDAGGSGDPRPRAKQQTKAPRP